MRSRMPAVALAVFPLGLTAFACSGSGSPPSSTASPSPTVGGQEEDAGTQWAERDAGTRDERACMALARKADIDGCDECCAAVYPQQWASAWDSLRACACRKPQPTCAKACGPEYCAATLASENASEECASCLLDAWGAKDYDCIEAWAPKCAADPACDTFLRCTDACEVAGQDGGAADGG